MLELENKRGDVARLIAHSRLLGEIARLRYLREQREQRERERAKDQQFHDYICGRALLMEAGEQGIGPLARLYGYERKR